MKQRYGKRQPKDEKSVEYLVSQGVPRNFAEAMSARGVCEENFGYYCDSECFHSPFEMKNMREAAEIVSYVVEGGGSVLICGDYDADGLTASAILSLFFADNGVDNDVLIPTRELGYGLHFETVKEAFSRKFYDLVITVDCGISNKAEVEKILDEFGVEVIVTDHHELPEMLPPCLCVNPKMGYPFPYLAGAGVAWKLVEALSDRQTAAKYADLAMIGTLGDSMPLCDENRSIVKLGLATAGHKSLKKLAELSKCPERISASDVSMKIVPKINAAGRMGAPDTALQVLLSRDKGSPLVEKLLELNEQRRAAENEVISQADKICDAEEIRSTGLAFLYGENWQHGILGIVAARYKEKFGVTAVVLTKNGEDVYVGSARGIEGSDLFEIFSRVKDVLIKFGGHKAAVGFSVSAQNLQLLKTRLVEVISELGQTMRVERQILYDVDLSDGVGLTDAFEFCQKMEPLLPQEKLLFHFKDTVKSANTFGRESNHLSVVLGGGLELKSFFKRAEYAEIIAQGADVEGVVSLSFDDYSKRVVGVVEDMCLLNSVCFDDFYKLNLLRNFASDDDICGISAECVGDILAKPGTIAVFDDYETYLAQSCLFDFSDFREDIFFDGGFSAKTVAVSPRSDYDFSGYRQIVYFCNRGYLRALPQNAKHFYVTPANAALYDVGLNRDLCAAVYLQLKRKNRFDSIRGVFDKYLLGKMDYCQYVAALRVFEELSLVEIVDRYTVEILPSQKVDLTESKIYNAVASNVGETDA